MSGHRISWRACALFLAVHALAIGGAAATGVRTGWVTLAVAMYAVRMFAIAAGTHRGLAHRAFETSRAFQFVLAVVASTTSQLGVLWWASQHRLHHRYSDRPDDPHASTEGFWWAYAGWFLVDSHDATAWDQIPDLAGYPELRWLDRYWGVTVVAFVALLAACGGWQAVVWGFGVSTVMLWHASGALTAIAHRVGSRRYQTRDHSRNNALVALATLGEGWHNNHHHHPGSARHGVAWWELDVTHVGLRALAAVGLVRNLRPTPARARIAA